MSMRGRLLVVAVLTASVVVAASPGAPGGPAIVGIAATPDGGAWTADAAGRVWAHGAPALGSAPGGLRQPVVGLAATPTGRGYWLVARDGGIFTFGDARFLGSTGAMRLNQPVVGMAPTPSGRGYWLVARDGGIFTFGDARFLGSTGGLRLRQPIVAMAPTASGRGYWLVAGDGGVFTFGDAAFHGSGAATGKRFVGVARSGAGYWLVAADGTVVARGDAAAAPSFAAPIAAAATSSSSSFAVVTADNRVRRPPAVLSGTRDVSLWPFASTSPWNVPIGDGARFAPVDDPATRSARSTAVDGWINAGQYSIPVVRADDTDPMATLRPRSQPAVRLRLPSTAQPAKGSDAHLTVVEPDGRWLDESYGTAGSPPELTSRHHVRQDLFGPGVGEGGTRAYGGSAIGGLIRAWELQAGVVRHALAIGVSAGQLRQGPVWPATNEDADGGQSYKGNLPMGSLLAVPPDVDVTALGLSSEGVVVARALQDHGGYVVDRADCFCLYAEPGLEGGAALTAMRRDVARIRAVLRVVANNAPTSVGGGGRTRTAYAPALPGEWSTR